MEPNLQKTSDSILKTYACRLARKLYLQRKCEESHPVLIVEGHLVEMALSTLSEAVLATKADVQVVVKEIKRHSIESIYHLVDDDELRASITEEITKMTQGEILNWPN